MLASLTEKRAFITRLKALPIDVAPQAPAEILDLPVLARKHNLTNYDAAYLALAVRFELPVATTDTTLRQAAASIGCSIVPG